MLTLRATILLILACFSSDAVANPTLRPGWPYTLPTPVTWNFVRTQPISAFENRPGEKLLAVASIHDLALLSLDGQVLPGWPIQAQYWIDGPVVGVTDPGSEPHIYMTRGDVYHHHREIVKLDLQGNVDPAFHFIFENQSISMGISKPVLADIDNDGLLEVLFTSDSLLYVANGDGSLLPGFPWELGGQIHWLLPVIAGLDLPGGDDVLLWATTTHLHARRIEDGLELPGWPIYVNCVADGNPMTHLLIPLQHENSWALCVVARTLIHLFGADGSQRPGFPRPPEGSLNRSTVRLSAGDVDGDGIPEIIFKPNSPDVHVLNLEAEYLPGYPFPSTPPGTGENVVSMRKPDVDQAYLLFNSQSTVPSDVYTYALNNLNPLPGFPHLLRFSDSHAHSSVLVTLVRQDGIHLVINSGRGEIMVWDWEFDTEGLVLEYAMPNSNPQGNAVYQPRRWDEQPNRSPTPFHRLAPGGRLHLPGDTLTFRWEASRDSEGAPIEYTLSFQLHGLDSSVVTDDTSHFILMESFNLPPGDYPLRWLVTATDGIGRINCIDAWGEVMLRVGNLPVREEGSLPTRFRIEGIYPNPFNPASTLSLTLPRGGEVTIELFDVNGRLVSAERNLSLSVGHHHIPLNKSAQLTSSGLYFIRASVHYRDGSTEVGVVKGILMK